MGILTHTDYYQIEDTLIYTPCYVNGNTLGGDSAGENDVLSLAPLPYNATGQLIDVKTISIDTDPAPHTDLPADKTFTSQDAASVCDT